MRDSRHEKRGKTAGIRAPPCGRVKNRGKLCIFAGREAGSAHFKNEERRKMKKTKHALCSGRAFLCAAALLFTTVFSAALSGCGSDEGFSLNDLGVFKMGMILPTEKYELGKNTRPGVRLAVSEMENAGLRINLVERESAACNLETARRSFDQLAAEGANGIVGAGCSSVSIGLLQKAAGQKIVLVSPSSSSADLTPGFNPSRDSSDGGFFFRTQASDAFRASVAAQEIERDGGAERLVIIYADDVFGNALKDSLVEAVTEDGSSVAAQIAYERTDDETYELSYFANAAMETASANPDAVVIIPVDGPERQAIVGALIDIDQNVGPGDVRIYFAGVAPGTLNATTAGLLGEPADEVLVEGIKAVRAGYSREDRYEGFSRRAAEFVPPAEAGCRGCIRRSYDAAVVMVLAAVAARSVDPAVYSAEVTGVTRGGEKCFEISQCLDMLVQGRDIDYDGPSGPLEFDENGEPSQGVYDIMEYDSQGVPMRLRSILFP